MLDIQVLTADDWPLWRELRLVALAEAPFAFGSRLADWQGDGDREQRWRDRIGLPGSYNVVGLLDGRPVGMASGVPADRAAQVELISMWVSPAARGRGVGEALVEDVTRWARAAGAESVRLSVMPGNAAARALYERLGFRFTSELGDPLPDGAGHELIMERPLPR